jgi:hypothetical protein
MGILLLGAALLLAACGPAESERSTGESGTGDQAVVAEVSGEASPNREEAAPAAGSAPVVAADESPSAPEAESATPAESTSEVAPAEPESAAESSPADDVAAATEPIPGDRPLTTALDEAPGGELTAEEIAGVQFMREEEKLAHDVYVALYEMWGVNVFDNIARSEQTHTDAVLRLLDKYGLADPAAGQPAGIFTDPALQALYDDLMARGAVSAQAALEVGALIEDVDIADLMARAANTDNEDIALLYASLQRGSENHLRAFTGLLSNRYGVEYTPLYIDQALYDEILSGSAGSAGRGAGGNGAGGTGVGNGRGNGRGGPRS